MDVIFVLIDISGHFTRKRAAQPRHTLQKRDKTKAAPKSAARPWHTLEWQGTNSHKYSYRVAITYSIADFWILLTVHTSGFNRELRVLDTCVGWDEVGCDNAVRWRSVEHVATGYWAGSYIAHVRAQRLGGMTCSEVSNKATGSIQHATRVHDAKLAILISGQRARFLFADGNFKLAAGVGVFVRLQDWNNVSAIRPWTGPTPERPSYGVEFHQVVQYFREIGAASVNVEIMSYAALMQLRTRVEAVLAKPRFKPQFESNLNMLLLRHLVYQDMLAYEKSQGIRYQHVFYVREDIVLSPPQSPGVLLPDDVELCESTGL